MSATSHSTSFRFFGALKSLFSKPETNGNGAPSSQPVSKPAPAPVRPAVPAAKPGPRPSAHHALNGNGKSIELPLQTVLMAMSQDLRSRIRSAVSEDLTVTISLDKILPQLVKGTVKIPFGDIRRAAPHVFTTATDCDHLPVALPLSEVLSRINPSALSRRPAQKQVQVSEEVISPFNGRGQGLTIVNEPTGVTPPPNIPNPLPRAMTPSAPRFAGTPPAAPRTAMPASPVVPVKPVVPRNGVPPFSLAPGSSPLTPGPSAPSLPAARPAPMPEQRPIPMSPAIPLTKPAPAASSPAAATPALPITSFLPAAPVAPAALARPTAATATPVLMVTLSSLAESWPEKLRQELAQGNLISSQIALPIDVVEAGLKRGRVTIPWKTLRNWLRPAPKPGESANDALELELPLKVLAPLFLSRQKAAAKSQQQRTAVDESIPNLFFGFPQPGAPAPVIQPAPASQLAPPAPSPALSPAGKPVDTNYYIWSDSSDTAIIRANEVNRKSVSTGTEFIKRCATPNEIVSRAAALDGVAGALIALPDGLMVASQIPADLNGDTLAAFLPQLFSKMSQCTKELRMGELNNLNFTVGNIPWKIFRVNAVFFATFGRIGQPLPTAQLAALAGELDRKNKQ